MFAHGAVLRVYEKSLQISEEISTNYKKANKTDRQKAMLDFAIKICNCSHNVCEDDFTRLHSHGFNDEDIWDIGSITALFALSNRMAGLTSMLPNPEFFRIGQNLLGLHNE